MKVLFGIQARTHSQRLPKKIYEKIGSRSLLQIVYDSCHEATRKLNMIPMASEACVLGTEGDLELRSYCLQNSINAFFSKSDENELFDRYIDAAKEKEATHIIRVTADCWQTNPLLLCEVAMMLKEADYVSNTIFRTFPEGLDLQGCSLEALLWIDADQDTEREHPFSIFDQNKRVRDEFERDGFKILELLNPQNPATIHTSIDTQKDLDLAREVYDKTKKTGPKLAGAR